MLQLPTSYIDQMKRMLGEEEAAAFLRSYSLPRTQGLRLNPLKAAADSALAERLQALFELTPVHWCPTGFYYDEHLRPGKHPYHAAGLYYIQEPSAMSAVELLQPEPGDLVLDLAAAPGGKTTQIAGKLQGKGLLIANEIHPARAKILSENVERLGIANAVVCSAAPDQLTTRFREFFDKIMLDAPCSGEGMFRKDPAAIAEWSPAHVAMCAARQLDILPDAVEMLKPGGLLAYSTCTFNREENEQTVAALLRLHPQMELLRTERIWPHVQRGEGHFVALLQKKPADQEDAWPAGKTKGGHTQAGKANKSAASAMQLFEQFRQQALPGLQLQPGEAVLFGDQLYWLPRPADCPFDSSSLNGLKTLRPGLHLGTLKKSRFEPSHALALALENAGCQAALVYSLEADSKEAAAYLRGEALFIDSKGQGWAIVCADGAALGWGKISGGQLKNHYPKGLRWPL